MEREEMTAGRMTVKEMQIAVDRWIRSIGGGYFSELTNMVILAEEIGRASCRERV